MFITENDTDVEIWLKHEPANQVRLNVAIIDKPILVISSVFFNPHSKSTINR